MKKACHRYLPAIPCGLPVIHNPTLYFISTFLFIFFAISSKVSAGDPQLYTNEDLERYERQYQSEKEFTAQSKKDGKLRKASGRVRHVDQQEYWCKRGTAAQEKLDQAKEKVVKAEEYCAEMRSKTFWRRGAQRKVAASERKLEKALEKAKENLQAAERTYRKTDDEAHRKGIPPGWLRCQF